MNGPLQVDQASATHRSAGSGNTYFELTHSFDTCLDERCPACTRIALSLVR